MGVLPRVNCTSNRFRMGTQIRDPKDFGQRIFACWTRILSKNQPKSRTFGKPAAINSLPFRLPMSFLADTIYGRFESVGWLLRDFSKARLKSGRRDEPV